MEQVLQAAVATPNQFDDFMFCSVLFCFHYPTRDPQARQSLIQQGVTIFISQLNDLNAEKILAQR